MTKLKTRRLLASLGSAVTTISAQAEAQLAPVLARTEEPQSAALAFVGLGLLVLSAMARRRNDP